MLKNVNHSIFIRQCFKLIQYVVASEFSPALLVLATGSVLETCDGLSSHV